MRHHAFACVAALALVAPAAAAAADAEIVAVVACDPYADLKKQIRWVGVLVDQPALDGFAESFIMMATQFKGLAGLDVTRPAGLVIAGGGDVPTAHAYVPVKDIDKLLDSLVGVLGPVEEADGVRRVSPPGGMPLDIVEKEGWAIIGPRDSVAPAVDPAAVFAPIVAPFTVGMQAFPSRMPDGMRRQLETMLEQAARMAADRGQAVDRAGVATMLESLHETESLLVGVAIDMEQERIALESQTRMVPESRAVGAWAEAAKTAVTVAPPATADGKPPAVSAHVAMAVPAALRQAAVDAVSGLTADENSPPDRVGAMTVLREALGAMIEAGAYDAALAIDTSVADGDAPQPVPGVTLGMRVKDGAALEARLKKALADAGAPADLKVAFDTGKAAGANLHTITLPAGAAADEPVDLTLAVAPTYAYVLAGGDVPKRLAAVVAASGKPDRDREPLADVTLAVGPLLRYAAALARADDDAAADPDGLEAAAEIADAQDSALVRLSARPIDRGMALRLSADAGAVRTVAASVKPQAPAPGPAARELRPGPPRPPALAP